MKCDSCRQGDDWLAMALSGDVPDEPARRQARQAHRLCARGDCPCDCTP